MSPSQKKQKTLKQKDSQKGNQHLEDLQSSTQLQPQPSKNQCNQRQQPWLSYYRRQSENNRQQQQIWNSIEMYGQRSKDAGGHRDATNSYTPSYHQHCQNLTSTVQMQPQPQPYQLQYNQYQQPQWCPRHYMHSQHGQQQQRMSQGPGLAVSTINPGRTTDYSPSIIQGLSFVSPFAQPSHYGIPYGQHPHFYGSQYDPLLPSASMGGDSHTDQSLSVKVHTSTVCSLCNLTNVDTIMKPCGHTIHARCLSPHLETIFGPPVCPRCSTYIQSAELAVPTEEIKHSTSSTPQQQTRQQPRVHQVQPASLASTSNATSRIHSSRAHVPVQVDNNLTAITASNAPRPHLLTVPNVISIPSENSSTSSAARLQPSWLDTNRRIHTTSVSSNTPSAPATKVPAVINNTKERKSVKRKAPECVSSDDKKPSKIDQIEPENGDKECCICLEEPSSLEIATINGCAHKFCFSCIENWSERENTCPLCKTRFTKIERVSKKRKKGTKVSKNVRKRDQRREIPGIGINVMRRIIATYDSLADNPIVLLSNFPGSMPVGLAGPPNATSSTSTSNNVANQQQQHRSHLPFPLDIGDEDDCIIS